MQFVAGAGKVKQVTKTVHVVPHSLSHESTHVLFTDLMFTAQRIVTTYKTVNVFSVNCTTSAHVPTCANYIQGGYST